MPLYQYECGKCGVEFTARHPMAESNKRTKCECGGIGKKIFTIARNHVFEKRVFEHLGPEPIMVESKKQLKQECLKRGIDPQRVPALN